MTRRVSNVATVILTSETDHPAEGVGECVVNERFRGSGSGALSNFLTSGIARGCLVAATNIGIAIVESNGHYLVGTREAGLDLAGFAEFPGGKCHAAESPDRCAERECLEETGIAVVARQSLDETTFDYPHGTVELHFWLCSVVPNDPAIRPLGNFRWLTRDELAHQNFPAANAGVLRKLLATEH